MCSSSVQCSRGSVSTLVQPADWNWNQATYPPLLHITITYRVFHTIHNIKQRVILAIYPEIGLGPWIFIKPSTISRCPVHVPTGPGQIAGCPDLSIKLSTKGILLPSLTLLLPSAHGFCATFDVIWWTLAKLVGGREEGKGGLFSCFQFRPISD